MKKNRLFFMFAALFVAAVVLFSCQKEEMAKMEGGMLLKAAPVDSPCNTGCIDMAASENAYFPVTKSGSTTAKGAFSVTFYNTATHMVYVFNLGENSCIRLNNSSGNTISSPYMVELSPGWKACDPVNQTFWIGANNCTGTGAGQTATIVTEYYLVGICTSTAITTDVEIDEPLCEGEEVVITGTASAGGSFTGGKIKLQQFVAGEWLTVAWEDVTAENKEVIYAYEVAAGVAKFRATYDGAGSNGYNPSWSKEMEIEGKVCIDCTESFSYVPNPDGSYTFTYMPVEDMQNADVVFTFAQSAEVELEGFSPVGNTMQATLNFKACEEVSWTVKFVELGCKGKGQETVNAWTDFKINDNSKKNIHTPNIELPCGE